MMHKGGRTPNEKSASAVRESVPSSRALLEKRNALFIGNLHGLVGLPEISDVRNLFDDVTLLN